MEKTLSLNKNNVLRISTKKVPAAKIYTGIRIIQDIISTFPYKEKLHWLIFDSDTIPDHESSFFYHDHLDPLMIGIKIDERNYLTIHYPEILRAITDIIFKPLKEINDPENYIKFVILHEFGHFLDYRRGMSLNPPPIKISDFDNLYSYITAYRNYHVEKSADNFVKEAWKKIGGVLNG